MYLPISIGIPAYNEEQYITRTLLAAINQPVAEIIISDNASTDKTSQICKEFAETHDRVHYLRKEINIGPIYNFRDCINAATKKYFMFLGAHDFIDTNHTLVLMEEIAKTQGTVGAYADAIHVDDDCNIIDKYHYWYHKDLMSESPFFRLSSLIKNVYNGSYFYGLYERDLLAKPLNDDDYILSDIYVVGRMVLYGKIARADGIYYFRTDQRVETESDRKKRYKEISSYLKKDYSSYIDEDISLLTKLAAADLFKRYAKMYPTEKQQLPNFPD